MKQLKPTIEFFYRIRRNDCEKINMQVNQFSEPEETIVKNKYTLIVESERSKSKNQIEERI